MNIETLISLACINYDLEIRMIGDLAFEYRQTGRDDWTSFHHETREKMIENLELLVKTGYAALPKRK